MEFPDNINFNFPSLCQFKGKPWSSLTSFLNESYRSKSVEDCNITNYMFPKIEMNSNQKAIMGAQDISQFRGQPWSSWIVNLDMNALSNNVEKMHNDCRVTRLPRQDMGLFGICPENDKFCAVICSTCGSVVKPQGLQRHLELRHASESETVLLPPPQVPVKKNKTVSVKMKNKESTPAPVSVHSSENSIPCLQPAVSVKVEPSASTTTTTKSYTGKTVSFASSYDTDSNLFNHTTQRKPPNVGSDRKAQKVRDKEFELDEHGVVEQSTKKLSNRLNCKQHLSSPRRTPTGRTKDFNKLVAEHRATKEHPSATIISTSTKSSTRPQSVLKTVVTTSSDTSDSFSLCSTSQSSLMANQDSSPPADSSPQQMSSSPSPPMRGLHSIASSGSVALTNTSAASDSGLSSCNSFITNTPVMSTCSVDYLAKCASSNSSTCSSPTVSTALTDVDISVSLPGPSSHSTKNSNVNIALPLPVLTQTCVENDANSSSSSSMSSSSIVHVVPVSTSTTNQLIPPHVYTVKLPGSPVIILNSTSVGSSVSDSATSVPSATSASAAVPVVSSVNLNVNTESMSTATVTTPSSPKPVVVSRDIIQSLNVPVVMEVPKLSTESLANITLYTSYPKPLVVSTFSAKKVGNAVVFSNRRLDFIRSQFKSVLKKSRRVNTAMNTSVKGAQLASGTTSSPAMFGMKTLGGNGACRFPKTTTTLSGIQPTSLLSHRPNILRTTSPKQARDREQHMPKILATGLKRPAATSPKLTGLDCKHMLLKPTASNINVSGIIGQMIVHQHDVTETGDGPNTNHLSLDKVVPVNIN